MNKLSRTTRMSLSRRLAAGLTASGLLLLSACGSDEPAPAATTQSVPAAETSSEVAPDASADATTPSSADEDPSGSAGSATESSTDDSAESSSEPASEDPATGSTSADDQAYSGLPTNDEGQFVIGADATSLDEQSQAWFAQFCGASSAVSDLSPSDLASPDSISTSQLVTEGAALLNEAEDLRALPAPTFVGGDVMATNVVDWLRSAGESYQQAGAQLESGDTEAGVETLRTLFALEPFGDNAVFNPELQDDVAAIPGCGRS